LGGGGDGEAAWEEKKEAQEKPIRLAAALRHRASVPSPHPPAIASSLAASLGYSATITPFLAFLADGVNAPALPAFWFSFVVHGAHRHTLSLPLSTK
jgi:hypothetical protein